MGDLLDAVRYAAIDAEQQDLTREIRRYASEILENQEVILQAVGMLHELRDGAKSQALQARCRKRYYQTRKMLGKE